MIHKVHKAVKHCFIPHEGNDYAPHFFRDVSVTIIFAGILILFIASSGSSFIIKNTRLGAAVLPAVIADLTNENRLENNIGILARNQTLDNAALLKAQDMANKSYFAHTSPEGITPWHWFSQAGYKFVYAGENLAVNFSESLDVQNAWLNSPTHKANILNAKFKEIGVATAEGIYNGSRTIFVVQMFGTPAFASQPVTETKPAPEKIAQAPEAKEEVLPEVAGEETNVIEQELEVIINTKEFTAVKNTLVEEPVEEIATTEVTKTEAQTEVVQYSKWYERLLFNQPNYTGTAYKVLALLILVALITMIVVEVRRQNPKHIFYGVLLSIILFSLIYINQEIFIYHFVL